MTGTTKTIHSERYLGLFHSMGSCVFKTNKREGQHT